MPVFDFIPKDYYVYIHRKKSDNSVFYVGKGCKRRAWNTFNRSAWWKRVAKKHGHIVEIVQDGLQEWYALELEAETILRYGIENLVNHKQSGGSFEINDEYRKKLSDCQRGRKRPDDVRKRMSESLKKAYAINEDLRKLRSLSMKGRKKSAEQILKMKNGPQCKPVQCSNGMSFSSYTAATDWLKEIGHAAASVSNIRKAVREPWRFSYGYQWRDCISPEHMV